MLLGGGGGQAATIEEENFNKNIFLSLASKVPGVCFVPRAIL